MKSKGKKFQQRRLDVWLEAALATPQLAMQGSC
jgi:hypothetical protein